MREPYRPIQRLYVPPVPNPETKPSHNGYARDNAEEYLQRGLPTPVSAIQLRRYGRTAVPATPPEIPAYITSFISQVNAMLVTAKVVGLEMGWSGSWTDAASLLGHANHEGFDESAAKATLAIMRDAVDYRVAQKTKGEPK